MTRYGSILSFQSTHPRGVRPAWQSDCKPMSDFNPRTHVGCDRASLLPPPGNGYFNPRTHVGCDGHQGLLLPDAAISIHAPTWGATGHGDFGARHNVISIHAPTWGATRSRRGRLSRSFYFNPRTHVGCDARRTFSPLASPISIHAPTWGATQVRGE